MTQPIRPLANKDKPSKVEEAKKNSHLLRGTLAEVLNDPAATTFEHDDLQVMKFHGIYQQDDRDARAANKPLGLDREYSFMVRVKVPGGALTAEQYLGMDRLADEVTYNDSLRVTTRQNFQLHGVLKVELKQAMQRINQVLLDTLCGCGDVERNIMAPPAPLGDPAHKAVRALAKQLSQGLCPQSRAYYEVWLDGEKVETSQEAEPLYGDTYLPRKFKTGVALPEDNSIDAHSQDVGLIAVVKDGVFQGVNILVGGGLGLTHKKPETYARLATELGYADAKDALEAVQVVIAMFRDYGDRTDRKHARLKYVVEEAGIEAFREEFNRRASFTLKPWVEVGELRHQDHLGAHPQGDGKFFYGVYIPNGRIIDDQNVRYKTAFRKIVEAFNPTVILTPNQNILFGDLEEDQIKAIERVLVGYNIPLVEGMSAVRRHAMACVSLPTCGLALTEAERVMPGVVDAFEAEFARLGLADEPITLRMTGCPNGCARPYTAEIGLVGHKPGHYDVFIGGSIHGHRMAEFFAENVPLADLVPTVRPLLEQWRDQRRPAESLGDFWERTYSNGRERPHIVTGDRDNPAITRLTVGATA